MDILNKVFPISFKCDTKDNFIKALIIYIIANVAAGIVTAFTASIPVLSFLFGLASSAVGLYATAGIVISILVFTKVLH